MWSHCRHNINNAFGGIEHDNLDFATLLLWSIVSAGSKVLSCINWRVHQRGKNGSAQLVAPCVGMTERERHYPYRARSNPSRSGWPYRHLARLGDGGWDWGWPPCCVGAKISHGVATICCGCGGLIRAPELAGMLVVEALPWSRAPIKLRCSWGASSLAIDGDGGAGRRPAGWRQAAREFRPHGRCRATAASYRMDVVQSTRAKRERERFEFRSTRDQIGLLDRARCKTWVLKCEEGIQFEPRSWKWYLQLFSLSCD